MTDDSSGLQRDVVYLLNDLYSALVYEPKCEGRGGVAWPQPMSTAVQDGALMNFGDLNPYLVYE
jgi:hypothetical protein